MIHILSSQVFRQQAETVKLAQQQQRHAAKVKAKEAVINSQLQAEEQAHQRAVAARKVQHSAACFGWTAQMKGSHMIKGCTSCALC